MSDLPKERFAMNEKPFSKTGIDYFGPIYVKTSRITRSTQGNNKRYRVLFICLTTRAIHLKRAGDLATGSFIMSLGRFISRGGNIRIIFSDNGTNLVGAEKELRLALKNFDFDLVAPKLSPWNTEWKFNPPSSAWVEGVWDSLIKEVKRSLKSVTNHQVFTEETLVTILCEIKSILNQQPLTAISDDCKGFEVLIPSHFLIGAYSPNLPPGVHFFFYKQSRI